METAVRSFREAVLRIKGFLSAAGDGGAARGSSASALRGGRAFTLLELVLVVAIIGTVSAIAVPSYLGHRDRVLAQEALGSIVSLDLTIQRFFTENGRFPNSLAEIGKGGMRDPWGNPYHYLRIANDPSHSECRKIRNVHPINTDFDLYSSGKDGLSPQPINAEPSWDDVIRAYDGAYMGLVRDLI